MGLLFRRASNGYWVALLLPLALCITDLNFEKQSKTAITIIAFHSFMLCVFHWMDVDLAAMLQRLRRVNISLTVVTIFICLARGGNLYEFVSCVALNFTFPYLFYNIIKQHPRTFTFGEGVLVTSAFAYIYWSASQSLPFPPSPIQTQSEPVLISLFLQGIFFVTILIARIFLLMQKPWKLYVLEEMFCLWSKYCIIAFLSRMPIQNDDEILWFLSLWPYNFLVATRLRIYIISYWAVVSGLTAIYLIYRNYYSTVTTTIDRKVFHFIIVAVFLPGIFLDHALIYCCSAIVFYMFLLIEVTSVYLLVGCSLPIWLTGLLQPHLHRTHNLKPLEYSACLAGILSIGVGDTFASIGGTVYGRTYWKNSRKTVEGTASSIIAQVIAAFLIFISGFVPYDAVSVTALIVGIMVNAVVEGKTDQIDNLVLPLITYIVVHGFSVLVSS